MAMPVPQKIVLKSSTSMSLNDRFSKISKFSPSVQTIRVQMSNQHEMTTRNRRFAQQMANRNLPVSPKGDVMSRLGAPNVLSRLGYRRGLGGNIRRGRTFRGGRGGKPAFQAVANVASPQAVSTRGTGRRGGKAARGAMANRSLNGDSMSGAVGQTPRGQRRFMRRGAANVSAAASGPARRQWGGRGRGRGGRGGRMAKEVEVTRDQLDNELDEYMANMD